MTNSDRATIVKELRHIAALWATSSLSEGQHAVIAAAADMLSSDETFEQRVLDETAEALTIADRVESLRPRIADLLEQLSEPENEYSDRMFVWRTKAETILRELID